MNGSEVIGSVFERLKAPMPMETEFVCKGNCGQYYYLHYEIYGNDLKENELLSLNESAFFVFMCPPY